jgi:hypothetical protein
VVRISSIVVGDEASVKLDGWMNGYSKTRERGGGAGLKWLGSMSECKSRKAFKQVAGQREAAGPQLK